MSLKGQARRRRATATWATRVAFYVEDVNAAVLYLKARGITVQGEPTTMQSGPSKGLTWIYFLSRWGMQLELVSYPAA